MQRYVQTRLLRSIKGHPIDFTYLSDHPDLTLEVIKEFPNAPWDWESIQNHDNMCLEWLSMEAPWDYVTLPDVDRWTFDWVRKYPERPWAWNFLHRHYDFDFKWVAEFPEKPWDYFDLSKIVTIDDLLRFPDLDWHWPTVTWASPVTPQEMVLNKDLPWDFTEFGFDAVDLSDVEFLETFASQLDWTDVSRRAEWELVKARPDLPWNWYHLEPEDVTEDDLDLIRSRDPSELNWKNLSLIVPFWLIVKNPELPWRYDWVSMNETLTFDDLVSGQNWDYSCVPCEPIPRIIRKWVAASVIKRQFKESISNPAYLMCRNRLQREWEALTTSSFYIDEVNLHREDF